MEGRWKNLALVLLVLAAVFLVYSFLAGPAPADFSAGREKISAIWANSGIESLDFTEAELKQVNNSQLDAAAEKLEAYYAELQGFGGGEEASALRGFTKINIAIANTLRSQKALIGLYDSKTSIDAPEDACLSMDYYSSLNSLTNEWVAFEMEQNSLLNEFISDYPNYAEQVSAQNLFADTGGAGGLLARSNEGIETLNEICGGTA